MWQFLHDAWWRLATQSHPQTFSDALACRALQTGSVAYRAAVALRNTAYDRRWIMPARLACGVVSVGNLTVGGTGKTACVELLAKKLTAMGRRVAILSRGYGVSRHDYWLRADQGRLVVDGEERPAWDGIADEPQLLAAHLDGVPVMVGPRRARIGRLACEQFGAEVVVVDDGFQHRRLQRDCDIVLVHARMPLGGWPMLPRGPMREPITSLARAHVVMITKADEAFATLGALEERLRGLAPDAAFVTALHAPSSLIDSATGLQDEPARLGGLRLGLVSSIGDPAGFEATLRQLHATVLWHRIFPDHHAYRASDWLAILRQAKMSRPDGVVTTEKDWVRLRSVVQDQRVPLIPLWILGIQMRVLSGEEALNARLAGVRAC
ncbi:MAG: tetraacyldisaccharide 4'-kinase [Candidatus Omnitrophica bacterium]|nr:tetraacyldisaccharide 4'-kinase [Candidatus Omnitrophota bacterium]